MNDLFGKDASTYAPCLSAIIKMDMSVTVSVLCITFTYFIKLRKINNYPLYNIFQTSQSL